MSDVENFEQAVHRLEHHLVEALAACDAVLDTAPTPERVEALARLVAPLSSALPSFAEAVEKWAQKSEPAPIRTRGDEGLSA